MLKYFLSSVDIVEFTLFFLPHMIFLVLSVLEIIYYKYSNLRYPFSQAWKHFGKRKTFRRTVTGKQLTLSHTIAADDYRRHCDKKRNCSK